MTRCVIVPFRLVALKGIEKDPMFQAPSINRGGNTMSWLMIGLLALGLYLAGMVLIIGLYALGTHAVGWIKALGTRPGRALSLARNRVFRHCWGRG